jgi:hypothetical protein
MSAPTPSAEAATTGSVTIRGRSRRAVREDVLDTPAEPISLTARGLRQKTGHIGTESTKMIREQRDARQGRVG